MVLTLKLTLLKFSQDGPAWNYVSKMHLENRCQILRNKSETGSANRGGACIRKSAIQKAFRKIRMYYLGHLSGIYWRCTLVKTRERDLSYS